MKPVIKSKTIGFNSMSAILATALMPFFPEEIRTNEYFYPALIAWFALGNIVLRFVTAQAIVWKVKNG